MCQQISLCSPQVLSSTPPGRKSDDLGGEGRLDEREPSHCNQETLGDALGSYDLRSSSVSRVEIQEKGSFYITYYPRLENA